MFSIQLNKQFITIETTSGKVKSVLEELNLANQLKNNDWKAEDLLNYVIPYDDINQIVEARRQASAQFLLDSL